MDGRRASAPPGDGGNDRHVIGILQRGRGALKEANVLLVHVQVDEAPDRAVVIDEALLEAGKLPGEIVDEIADRPRLRLDLGIASGETAERGGNAYEHGHRLPPARQARD